MLEICISIKGASLTLGEAEEMLGIGKVVDTARKVSTIKLSAKIKGKEFDLASLEWMYMFMCTFAALPECPDSLKLKLSTVFNGIDMTPSDMDDIHLALTRVGFDTVK